MQRRIVLVSALAAAVQGCGGGDPTVFPSATPAPAPASVPSGAIKIEVSYMPHYKGTAPPLPGDTSAGVPLLLVSPPSGVEFLGSAPPFTVELLLFGYPPVVKTVATFGQKSDIGIAYAFDVPTAFVTSPTYTCGSGTHLSEVRVTDKNGLALSKTFELCPDDSSDIAAEIVVP